MSKAFSVLIAVILVCVTVLALGALVNLSVDPAESEEYLADHGYTGLNLVDEKFYGKLGGLCSAENIEDVATEKYTFTATNPDGESVAVTVCQGAPFSGTHIESE